MIGDEMQKAMTGAKGTPEASIAAIPEYAGTVASSGGKQAQFIAVNVTGITDRRFIRKSKWHWNIAPDVYKEISSAYCVHAVPQLVVIGKDGIVKWVQTGSEAAGQLKAMIEGLLNRQK